MKRWLFTLAAAVSLVLCLATVGLWVRSYRVYDRLVWAELGGQYTTISSYKGEIGLSQDGPCPYELPLNWSSTPIRPGQTAVSVQSIAAADGRRWVTPLYDRDGLLLASGPFDILLPQRLIRARYSAVAVCTGLLPFVVAVSRAHEALRARRRRQIGLCITCGYDLRATPDRCPECGTVPAAASKSA